jgi:dipeptidyl aminopeptidase/acylaminoacyl peptidase
MKQTLPYGTWPSPISAERVASASRRFGQVQVDQGCVYWVESRPEEGGRSVLVTCDDDGVVSDVVPKDFSVRSRVHEYGGVAYVVQNGVVFCSNGDDGRVYRMTQDAEPLPITPDNSARYADFSIASDGQTIFCVREQHNSDTEPTNDMVCLKDDQVVVVVEGHDFYAAPRISSDGRKLAWLSWDHPNMPWDGTELWVADWCDGKIENATCVAGGVDEAVFQPTWGQDGHLYYVSDVSGWWNLYSWDGCKHTHLWQKEAEFGLPLWSLGMTTYVETQAGHWVCSYIENGNAELGTLDVPAQKTSSIDVPFSDYSAMAAEGNTVAFIGGGWDKALAVVRFDRLRSQYQVIRENDPDIDKDGLSCPEAIQYWTSRGFAVLDVNYRGSTGFGRVYRRALDGQWGVYDVQDCVAGAQYLANTERADDARLLIRGGSAGGLTTLGALAFYDVFKAGASYYGVSDLASLAQITHKFESQYLNRLIGGEDLEVTFKERSPLYAADQISAPVIFFQGKEDPVVPPIQTQSMADALSKNHIPVACVMFEGEMHGFRRAENIISSLNMEYAFYATIFELDCQDDLSEINIDHWPRK